jgi:hypothetical protein
MLCLLVEIHHIRERRRWIRKIQAYEQPVTK